MLSSLDGISSIRVYLSNDLRPLENRQSVYKAVQEVKKRFKEAIPLLDPVDDMKVEDDGFKKLLGKMETLEKRLKEHPLAKSAQLPSLYAAYEAKVSHKPSSRAFSFAPWTLCFFGSSYHGISCVSF